MGRYFCKKCRRSIEAEKDGACPECNAPFSELEPQEKVNCFVLNKALIGSWADDDRNIPHEIINFYKTDQGNIYIYNTPYGCHVSGDIDKDYNVKWMFLTSNATSRGYIVQYCIEIEKIMHHCSRGKIQKKYNKNAAIADVDRGKKEIGNWLKDLTYGGKTLNQLFDVDYTEVFPFTYKAKTIYKYKPNQNSHSKPLCFPLKVPVDYKKGEDKKPYDFRRNFGYVPEKTNDQTRRESYSIAYKMLENWVEEIKINKDDWKVVAGDGASTKNDDDVIDRFKSTLVKDIDKKAVSRKTFIDFIDNFKAEECYTKILSKLFSYNECNFLKQFIKKIYENLGKKIDLSKQNFKGGGDNSALGITKFDEFDTNDYGRIDIYAESEKYCVIIENKIDSNFGNDQLPRYQTWVKSKTPKEPIFIVLVPEYRYDEIRAEQDIIFEEYKTLGGKKTISKIVKKKKRNMTYFFEKKYIICSYKEIYDIFSNLQENYFKNFEYKYLLEDVELMLKRLSMSLHEYYAAKLANKIDKIK